MAQIQTSSADGLPKHFVTAMRTLFDIMDDQNTGFVKFSDIEGRWQDDGTQGLPKGVLDSLKKVTPPNGLLSFERFCTGLKICLLQVQTETDSKKHDELMDGRGGPELKLNKAYGPPKPPRMGAALEARTINSDRNFDKSEIRTVLQNWQMGLLMNDDKTVEKRQLPAVNYRSDTRTLLRPTRVLGDGKAVDLQNNQVGLQPKKPLNRRREPRRHTLQNGIDYNMMKRMKQIEQEKDVLLQGLAAVDKAREWYLKQISSTQEKIKHLGQAQQERLELQRARVLEVNRHLAALISSWERGGLPLHMNLAFLSTPTSTQLQQDILSSKKSQRIAILEQEKDNLVRELYNRQSNMVQSRRATMIHEQHDQTFM
ncbi:Suppressor APC domain-containing protein 2 [Eufriesea mexicana]|uniref:Suppressor APC domain-containing protein 2 n=1 Tax=Eufriesea mexicana TaxID=516756 RepID=A0A310SA82_9HYME|nr:Suppressor APC domain-containing protein 2 [Eufriesea mexicana]